MDAKTLRALVVTLSVALLGWLSVAVEPAPGQAQQGADYRAGFNNGRARCKGGVKAAAPGGSADFQRGFSDGCDSSVQDFKSKNPAEEDEGGVESGGGCCG